MTYFKVNTLKEREVQQTGVSPRDQLFTLRGSNGSRLLFVLFFLLAERRAQRTESLCVESDCVDYSVERGSKRLKGLWNTCVSQFGAAYSGGVSVLRSIFRWSSPHSHKVPAPRGDSVAYLTCFSAKARVNKKSADLLYNTYKRHGPQTPLKMFQKNPPQIPR